MKTGKSLVSINELSKQDIMDVMGLAGRIEAGYDLYADAAKGRILATLFYEPSTRTRLSFHSAMTRLGGQVLGFSDPKKSSQAKGETVFDTIKMVESYSDVIVIRHDKDGAARVASEATTRPVINAGDGANQHPTQTLLDIYSILKTQGKIQGLNIALAGDLKYGRTVHSLAIALGLFGCTLTFISPKNLGMPENIKERLKSSGVIFVETESMRDYIRQVDILYMTRIQRERFPDEDEFLKLKDVYVLRKDMLIGAKTNLRVMHPLPRVNEIDKDVDDTNYAYYFQQAENGIPVRMALLCMVLGLKVPGGLR